MNSTLNLGNLKKENNPILKGAAMKYILVTGGVISGVGKGWFIILCAWYIFSIGTFSFLIVFPILQKKIN